MLKKLRQSKKQYTALVKGTCRIYYTYIFPLQVIFMIKVALSEVTRSGRSELAVVWGEVGLSRVGTIATQARP
jgi:hypothetical protein